MDNQRKLWHRLVSRLRSNRTSCRFAPRPSRSLDDGMGSSAVIGSYLPGRYTPFARDQNSSRLQLQERDMSSWYASRNLWALARQTQSFTPKCLSGFNTQHILFGQGSFDDFSPSCWLENHLHRFGELRSQADDNSSQCIAENGFSLENENQVSGSRWQTSFPISIRSFSRNRNVNNTYSSSSGSSVSDVTHFYNNLNLTGFAFDPNSLISDLPPYSELPEDPPPPYAECPVPLSGRSQSSTSRRASSHVLSQDILW